MHLRLGLKPTIVVSSPQAAELFLRTHDLVFASRPPLEASKYISYNQKNMIMAPYGSYWRNIRKMCTLELLSNVKINSFKSMRKEELDLLIEYVKQAACSGIVVDISARVSSLTADMTCRMVFGKKYMEEEFDERGFKAVIKEVMELGAIFNLADYIPQTASLDLQCLRKRMKAVAKMFDEFFEKIIDEHVQSKDDSRTKDFVDLMLSFMGSEETEYQMDREHIKAIILFCSLNDNSFVSTLRRHQHTVTVRQVLLVLAVYDRFRFHLAAHDHEAILLVLIGQLRAV
ncbi:hypothetical protein JRO89_XS08G0023400 [Xanthoceras sorbifolium]|uniref:Cytochrome P450 CYP736A12-like protein n=1 Tax=Xanthoceras sorbifolium TaxID=99658 RepID=A0ABQ8HNA6_9ROSI|nr:hypothetical protein JRO89_XS08G0023400 [Xanthoceras sorbifolium]